MSRILLFCLLFISGAVNAIKRNPEGKEEKRKQKKTNVKAILKVVLELHLFAILLFTVILTAFSFLIQGPPATVVLYASIASYAIACLCVAADRPII